MADLDDVALGAPIHRGDRADVHRGQLAGLPVAVKSARPVDAPLYGTSCTVGGVSTLWSLRCAAYATSASRAGAGQFAADGARLAAELLASEAAQLGAHGHAWGHALRAIGALTIDGASRPALATGWHDAPALASLARAEQRRVVPAMLPALWDALADHPHGDVSPTNLLIGDRPILIDPAPLAVRGVELAHAAVASILEAVFVTTGWCYPLLPPHAVSTIPLGRGAALADHVGAYVASLTLSHHAPPVAVGQRTRMQAVGPRGRHLVDTIELVAVERAPADDDDDRHLRGGALRPRQPAGEPHPADLLALGIIYYELLTGAHPFASDRPLVPAWVDLATTDDKIDGADRLRATVARAVAPPSRRAADVTPAEDRLALALLALAIPDRAALDALVRDTRRRGTGGS